ncbi:MAG: hypothetical protein COA70_04750 [Planctomycetota bacterium]|nr:MAG: hypothetical protein COA70_04750 [Planctomycetota bacterium]
MTKRWFTAVFFAPFMLVFFFSCNGSGDAEALNDVFTDVVIFKGKVQATNPTYYDIVNGPGTFTYNAPGCGVFTYQTNCAGLVLIVIEDPILFEVPQSWTFVNGTWTSLTSGISGNLIVSDATNYTPPQAGPIITSPGMKAVVVAADTSFSLPQDAKYEAIFSAPNGPWDGTVIKGTRVVIVRREQGGVECEIPSLEVPIGEELPDFPNLTNPANIVVVETRPIYSIDSLIAGQLATFSIRGASPGGSVVLGYSFTGAGPTVTPFGVVDMSLPIMTLFVLSVDAMGGASITVPIPGGAMGATLYTQGVDLVSLQLTSSLAEVVQ